ncbi:MAG: AI-2E family transporter [Oculatellaceae cyanobacterium Prado106]|jgi:predicted PurR-regulated permease PerM|nr:AI-2E family transporter [Oculatellaceae cyanobacterium Prado106]
MKLGQWLGLFCLIVVVIMLWQIRQTLLLVFAAVVLATALNSVVQRLLKTGMPRSRAVMITLGLSLLVGTLFVALIVPPFISQFLQLLELLPRGVQSVVTWVERQWTLLPSWIAEIELPSTANLAQELQPLAQNLIRNFFAFFSNSLTALLQLLLVVILTIMLLADPVSYRGALIVLFPSFYRRRADAILTRCEIALDNWLGGALLSSAGVATLSAIGLTVLQIDFVLAQALLAGLLNFIPNIGPLISLLFPLIVAFLDAPWKAIAVFILYFVIQQVEAYWLTPTLMAKQVSLLPALTLASQIFFATFFGFLGLLLALPLTVIAMTWIQEVLIRDVLDPWKRDSPKRGAEFSEELALLEFSTDAPDLPKLDETETQEEA